MLRFLSLSSLPVLLLGLGACSSKVSSGASSPLTRTDSGAHPGEDASAGPGLRLNQLQAKGTHNSYHVAKPGTAIPDWKYSRDPLDVQLESQGVRALELDTHFDGANRVLGVYHVGGADDGTTCSLLTECLGTIKTWSDAHPGHHVLFIHIEPKETSLNQVVDFAAYADLLDQTILSVWPRERLVTPADVQGDAGTLREGVMAGGWPGIQETRGKLLFYLNERAAFHTAYTRGGSDVSGRLVFPESHVDESIGAVVILNGPTTDPIADAVNQGFLVRTMADAVPLPADTDARRVQALAGGAQIVSTDYPIVTDGGPTAFEIPGGTPSRCNPLTAPAGCTSFDIESPAMLTAAP